MDLYPPLTKHESPQPCRGARTAWPLSAKELSRAESQAQGENALAVNHLGTATAVFPIAALL
jgi:hypothetical protein